MRRCISGLAELFLVTSIICGSVSNAAGSEEQTIQETYRAWVQAANDKDIARWSTFLADDPYFDPADSAPLTSTEEIIDYYKKSFSDKWFSLKCIQKQVELSESGEMAWAHGICNATFTGPDGKKATGTSRWFKVWMKQSDGSWRGRVNTWKYVDQP